MKKFKKQRQKKTETDISRKDLSESRKEFSEKLSHCFQRLQTLSIKTALSFFSPADKRSLSENEGSNETTVKNTHSKPRQFRTKLEQKAWFNFDQHLDRYGEWIVEVTSSEVKKTASIKLKKKSVFIELYSPKKFSKRDRNVTVKKYTRSINSIS